MSICQAVKEGLLRRNTALELLEAQAATGNMIDPLTGKNIDNLVKLQFYHLATHL